MRISARAASLKASSTVAVMNRAKALLAAGEPVLNFSAGEPDFNTPERAKAAGMAAIAANQTKYIETAGDIGTRTLVADLLTRINGIPGVTPAHIILTAGVKMALYLAFESLFDAPAPGVPAQEFILPVPAWVSFAPMATLAGAKVVEVQMTPETGFKLTAAALKAAITPRSRAVLINAPSNPCSTMYTREELEAIAAVVAEAAATIAPELVIVADELYQNIVFGAVPFMSIGSIPSVAERTITINGPGKSFAMTGWRLGWASGSAEFGKAVIGAMTKLQGQTTTCVPAFALAAMRSALTECEDDLAMMRAAFARRADLIFSLLSAIPGVKVARPVGAFYVFPDISAYLGKTTPKGKRLDGAKEVADALLEEQQMAVVPGEDFGGTGYRNIRISFACPEAQIEEGMRRLGAFLKSLK
ncbi:pyridoxal phosphate-dependent aminotransferase [soil metagenome]